MDELITWLRAQLDDDERVAREAIAEHDGEASWPIEPPDPTEPWARPRLLWLAVQDSTDTSTMPPAMAEHIARWDPARVLVEVEAKRRVLARYEDAIARQQDAEHSQITAHAQAQEYADWIIPALAQPYAGQPGWREEWAA